MLKANVACASDVELLDRILNVIERDKTSLAAYEDAFACILNICKKTGTVDLALSERLKRLLSSGQMEAKKLSMDSLRGDLLAIYKKILCWEAPVCFDSFLLYIESNRPYADQFYLPRRNYLRQVVSAYQEVADGKLKLLTISLVKRSGKSQTGINFVNWLSGRFPDRSSLMEGAGDALVKSFYAGCLEYLSEPSDYLFYDVFPSAKLVQTNADIKTINLNSRSRFPTIMCRSIDSSQVGLSEATNVLYLDDCVEGRKLAKNKTLLENTWEVIRGDVIGRAIEGTPIVASGTRYSLYDPIEMLKEHARKEGWAYKSIELPALDPVTDESNYEFYHPKLDRKVFTTAFFREQREFLSEEQFESEFQQNPFEAKGLLFPKDSLNTFFELPVDCDADATIAICDTAESGSDSTSMGVFKIYGEYVFLIDVVFDNSAPEITKPQCAKAIMSHGVSVAVFESNGAGTYFAKDVEQIVKSNGGKCSIRTKRTITNKQTRIEFASDGILKHFYFLHPSKYDKRSQYADFIRELTAYTRSGTVPHDDAADMLSLAENEIRSLSGSKVSVIRSPFAMI